MSALLVMKVTSKTERVTQWRMQLTGRDIVRLLKKQGYHFPKDTQVMVTVPRGGDYSGQTLEIDKEMPITVSAKTYDKKHIRSKK